MEVGAIRGRLLVMATLYSEGCFLYAFPVASRHGRCQIKKVLAANTLMYHSHWNILLVLKFEVTKSPQSYPHSCGLFYACAICVPAVWEEVDMCSRDSMKVSMSSRRYRTDL